MPGKRVVFYTFGSLGDLFPVVALARELKRRGHTAVIATSPAHRMRVEAAGLELHPVRPTSIHLTRRCCAEPWTCTTARATSYAK